MKIGLKTWIIAGTAILNIPLTISSCITTKETKEPKKEIQEIDNNWKVKEYIDPETGVNYLIFDHYGKAGVVVRVDENGKPIITNKEITK